MKIINGDIARDKITGLTGVVVCESLWLNGCRRLTIQPQKLKDGKTAESETFDEFQLEIVKRQVIEGRNETGGPRPEPKRGF